MINLDSCLKCFIYLAFYFTAIGSSSSPVPERRTPASHSSPFAHNGTEQLYSEWSHWTPCSSTCGLGIITRTRTCLKSAYNSRGVYVPLCHAEYAEHKICILKECPPDAPQARAIQCAHHNNRTVAGRVVQEWLPADGGPNPCELRCRAKSSAEGLEYGFGKVSNGTPCPRGVCLDGRCLVIGCDDRLGSEVVLDMCGVCGGRNASCIHYKDVFMGQPPADSDRRNGYHEVVVLPVGARNIIIRQLVGKNYLALQDRTRGIIFNGEQHLTQYGGHFDIAGTRVQFEKSNNASTEVLTAKGPVTEELYVLVLLRTFNQGIYYEYWLPKQSHNPSRSQYSLRRATNGYSSTTSTTTKSPSQYSSAAVYARPRPTKPAYAYGYGERPYKSQDAPVFRHHVPSTTASPTPRYSKSPVSQPYAAPQYRPIPPSPSGRNYAPNRKDASLMYVPRTYGPPGGYYQTYRNASPVDVKRVLPDLELPVLTQPDSSGSDGRGRYDDAIPNTVLNEKETVPKSQKPSRSTIEISKRGEKGRNFVTNGRLKYSLQNKDADEVYVNTSVKYTPAPLAIALLPSPDDDKFSRGSKRGGGRPKKTRLGKGGACEPCERSRDQTKHFCESDFVIRGLVIGYEFLQGETRYELEVRQTFKNTLSLLPKEFVWSPSDTCRCPRLRSGKEYVIMGRIDNNYRKRESRLLVDRTCFVRTFNLKYARRLQKLRKDRAKKCAKTS